MAAAHGGQPEIVKLLIEKGAEINAKDKSGWTALMLAARGGYPEIVKMLIEKGADFRITDKHGWSVLVTAVRERSHGRSPDCLLKRASRAGSKTSRTL